MKLLSLAVLGIFVWMLCGTAAAPYLAGQAHGQDARYQFTDHITLDSLPKTAHIGEMITFEGSISVDGYDTEGLVIYIKDADITGTDDLLATAYVEKDGRFSAGWHVVQVDGEKDHTIEVYASFDGGDLMGSATSCGPAHTSAAGMDCKYVVITISEEPETSSHESLNNRCAHRDPECIGMAASQNVREYIELYYALDFDKSPHVAIVPNPDSYNQAKRYVESVQKGVLVWTGLLEDMQPGEWDVTFEVIQPEQGTFVKRPDIVMNINAPDDDPECFDGYLGYAIIHQMPQKPIQAAVCIKEGYPEERIISTAAHEFIHAMGLGHAFNVDGDLMCSTENDIPTCDVYGILASPSRLNLEAVLALYGPDGYTNPNNVIEYGEIFSASPVNSGRMMISAENPTFENHFAGPQIVEVSVMDPDNMDTDKAMTEPDVTVNGNRLRMIQATDGIWYGYFADRAMVENADARGVLDFGTITDAIGFFESADAVAGSSTNTLENTKDINLFQRGQVGLSQSPGWPFIQLYDFRPDSMVTVQYTGNINVQSAALTFGSVDKFSDVRLDRETYPQGAQIHATITDAWLNIDPTSEDSWTFDTIHGAIYYGVFDDAGKQIPADHAQAELTEVGSMMCGGCSLLITGDMQNVIGRIIEFQANAESSLLGLEQQVTVTETGASSGEFGTYDESGISTVRTADDAQDGASLTFHYGNMGATALVRTGLPAIHIPDIDAKPREIISVIIKDENANKNGHNIEEMVLSNPDTLQIPAFRTGMPFTLGSGDARVALTNFHSNNDGIVPSPIQFTGLAKAAITVQPYSERGIITPDGKSGIQVDTILIDFGAQMSTIRETLFDPTDSDFKGFNFYNQDVESTGFESAYDIYLIHAAGPIITADGHIGSNMFAKKIAGDLQAQSGLAFIDAETASYLASEQSISEHNTGLAIVSKYDNQDADNLGAMPIVADFFSYGLITDGHKYDGIANQIIRIEPEETGSNTGIFEGETEYVITNQASVLDISTYDRLVTIDQDPAFVVIDGATGDDAVRVSYIGLDGNGVQKQISDLQEIPTHTGSISLDMETYGLGDPVLVTVRDADLNADSDFIDIYTITNLDDTVGMDVAFDGKSIETDTGNLGRILDVTFDGMLWSAPASSACKEQIRAGDAGLAATGFILIETGADTGVFEGDFQIPTRLCSDKNPYSTSGAEVKVSYVDFRDKSGRIIETADSAHIKEHIGSVNLDRTVYPVPFGPGVIETAPGEYLPQGDLAVHIRIDDITRDITEGYPDVINVKGTGPIKITVQREAEEIILGYAGGSDAPLGENFGPIVETADAGVFEVTVPVRYNGGPQDARCPTKDMHCILRGDALHVEYIMDHIEGAGMVTDSAVFELRDGQLHTDKAIYITKSDIIMTLTEPDLDMDSRQVDRHSLDIISWNSPAHNGSIGEFDSEPYLLETGASTGIFVAFINMPVKINGNILERGEEIMLKYTDYGPADSIHVGSDIISVKYNIYTSDFGAEIKFDQDTYTWTDKVYITIISPDYNFDDDIIESIGDTELNDIIIFTGGGRLDNYRLVEIGSDTGVFGGEIILTGFDYDAVPHGNAQKGTGGYGPVDGYLKAYGNDTIAVLYRMTAGEDTIGAVPIQWNVGQIQWLDSRYAVSEKGAIRVIDPDMNVDPEARDSFEIDVWSDSDSGGIGLAVTETGVATGIFEGVVYFTTTDESSDNTTLLVGEGDIINAEYTDKTLPVPYDDTDELDVYATSVIGADTTLDILAYHDVNGDRNHGAAEAEFEGLIIMTYVPSTGMARILTTDAGGVAAASMPAVTYYVIALPGPGQEITTNKFTYGDAAYYGVVHVKDPVAGSAHHMEIGVSASGSE